MYIFRSVVNTQFWGRRERSGSACVAAPQRGPRAVQRIGATGRRSDRPGRDDAARLARRAVQRDRGGSAEAVFKRGRGWVSEIFSLGLDWNLFLLAELHPRLNDGW